MKILVTGANGQVGYCLAQQLHQSGWQYQALAKEELDIADVNAVNAKVNDYRPNLIINAAAYTAVDKAETEIELAYKINRDGAKNLAAAADRVDAAIFHISTDYVFAGDAAEPYSEDAPTAPQGIYGASKLAGEIAVASNNPKHIIMRTAWGFGEHGNNFVKTMLRLGKTRDQLGIVSDQQGGPTYAGDIAKTLLTIARALENKNTLPWGIYHYSGAPYTHWFAFAEAIFAQASRAGIYDKKIPQLNPIGTKDFPLPAKRPANSRLNCEKIQKHFNIAPSNWQLALNNIKAYAE